MHALELIVPLLAVLSCQALGRGHSQYEEDRAKDHDKETVQTEGRPIIVRDMVLPLDDGRPVEGPYVRGLVLRVDDPEGEGIGAWIVKDPVSCVVHAQRIVR